MICFLSPTEFCQQNFFFKALIAMKNVEDTSSYNSKKTHSCSSLIKWCETHWQCLIKTLVSHPELLGFQQQETGSGLLNNSV